MIKFEFRILYLACGLFNCSEHRINVDATLKDTVFQFKGANVSMGAPRLACVCIAFENNFGANNFQGCLTCCQQLKEEYYVVKIKLQTLIGLQQQILAAGGSIPVIG
ncbi:hypothetical protein POM88_053022 [Heracleum sosnowskyi]|uniref:Histidine-containing phosphotransfer protein n=1 Tax=Heracleum sosnowskyi TaxID=360622 RepID=A0AAD8LXC0_9APIA|nr:hypothetical protein POM88_053022 [Heracleum sosnowskyi]